jgi:hypothetical protein
MSKILTSLFRNKLFKYFIWPVLIITVFCLIMYFTINNTTVRIGQIKLDESTTPEIDQQLPALEPEPVITEPLLFPEIVHVVYNNKADMQFLADATLNAMNRVQDELDRATYSEEAKEAMQQEIARLSAIFDKVQIDECNFDLWQKKLKQYPYATKTWLYLKEMGYSDEVCAGIIGNIMVECGGYSLKFNPFLYNKSGKHYGLMQWSRKYYPKADGIGFEAQLDFFKSNVKSIFKPWGKKYKKGFTYNDFLKLESPEEAALAFAKIYERCSHKTYKSRQRLAGVAYKYFVTDFKSY